MKKSGKAVLWSGLIYPGAGHFYLRQYLRGALLFAATSLGIAAAAEDLIARGLLTQIGSLADKILSGAIAPDAQSAGNLINLGPDTLVSTISPWFIVLCWVFGIADAYRIGRLQESDAAPNKPK